MRRIDADALIKETTEIRCTNCDRRKGMKNGKMTFVYEIGDVPCRACDVMDMIDALDEAPTISEWINVKDKAPEDGQQVVAISVNGFCEVVSFEERTGRWVGMEGWYPTDMIACWMELPEPPEEVSGDG